MAVVRDDMGHTVRVGTYVGVVCGGLVGFVSVVANPQPEQGFLGSLESFTPGMLVVLCVAVAIGAVIGGAVAAFESLVAYALSHRAAHSFQPLPMFAAILGIVCAALNATVTLAAVTLAYGVETSDALPSLVAGILTLIAVSGYAHLQSTDWPSNRPHAVRSPSPRNRVIDLRDDVTMRHDRLVDLVRERELDEQRKQMPHEGENT